MRLGLKGGWALLLPDAATLTPLQLPSGTSKHSRYPHPCAYTHAKLHPAPLPCPTHRRLAVAKGHKAVAQLLLRWGASALLQDNFGSTAKSEAQKYGRRELLELLEASEKLPRGSPLE